MLTSTWRGVALLFLLLFDFNILFYYIISGLFVLLLVLLSSSLECKRGYSIWIAGLMKWVRVHTYAYIRELLGKQGVILN